MSIIPKIVAGFLVVFLGAIVLNLSTQQTKTTNSSVYSNPEAVYLALPQGHCTATHLGDGYVLTAGHCLSDKVFKAKAVFNQLDTERSFNVERLWYNDTYDVGLARLTDEITGQVQDEKGKVTDITVEGEYSLLPSAGYTCREPKIGEFVSIVGNPLDMENIYTYGWVASQPGAIVPYWGYAVHGNVAAAPGNSGSPVYDENGDVLGILTGGRIPFIPMVVIVPTSKFCDLLGKGVL